MGARGSVVDGEGLEGLRGLLEHGELTAMRREGVGGIGGPVAMEGVVEAVGLDVDVAMRGPVQ
eukprot:746938-Hanusia_phi.AAC.1